MKILRRVFSFALLSAVVAMVVVVDRHTGSESVGASSAIVDFAGFPQVVDEARISTSWFCPGAAAGDGIDGASVTVVNPSDGDITATLNYLSDAPVDAQTFSVPARSRQVLDVLRGRTVGVVVPIVEIIGSLGSVEQELVYAAGDVTSQCVSQTSNSWYFADGFTAEGSTQRLVLTNPFPESAVVNVSYTTTNGRRTPAALQGIILDGRSARSISLADAGAQNEARLAVEVEASTGQIIASRIQHYLGAGRLGYSTTVGIPMASREWWFSSGRTGSLASELLMVFNPSDSNAQVNVTFFGEGITNGLAIDQASTAAAPSTAIDVPAGEVVAINTDSIAELPKGDHAMVVSSVNDVPVIVEHVLSQRLGGSSFTAITNGVPGGLVSTQWRIPSGVAKGTRNALSILNTTGTDGTFTVSASGPGGQVELPQLVNVALTAASLITVEVPDDVQDGEVTITATVPVVVQRRTARGHGLVGFGIVGALPIRFR